jgi:hypothetical protein
MRLIAMTFDVGPNVVLVVSAIIDAVVLVYVGKTRREMRPNGGSSLRDAVDRIEQHAKVAAAAAQADAAAPDPYTAVDIRDRPIGTP